ncbi:dihydroxyacetone kinase subunit DhaK [Trueperella sp. LYQ143]|uniref:dihydroxyacetone kinase subunit DhaK n=1 Tax=unclassified Trueperella TaxID=2630174 RepID=UPI00398320DD
MKKFINCPNDVVSETLAGMRVAHPHDLRIDLDTRVIYRRHPKTRGVALISGGGFGHEPLHGGFVGRGMLDAACCGEVFTSPVPQNILHAVEQVHTADGLIFLVKNYTGDVMNFEMAAECAADMGIAVETVIIADDVAVQDSLYTAGRRGIGGSVFVEKIAGAAAERGDTLAEVAALARYTADHTRSFGLALNACTVPTTAATSFDLGPEEIELGIGIHGEPGRCRAAFTSARELAPQIVEPIISDADFSGGPVIALLSGMGATPISELYLMYGEIHRVLTDEYGIDVARHLVGNYVTSLDMEGCALSLLRAHNDIIDLWDAPVATTALRWEA